MHLLEIRNVTKEFFVICRYLMTYDTYVIANTITEGYWLVADFRSLHIPILPEISMTFSLDFENGIATATISWIKEMMAANKCATNSNPLFALHSLLLLIPKKGLSLRYYFYFLHGIYILLQWVKCNLYFLKDALRRSYCNVYKKKNWILLTHSVYNRKGIEEVVTT